MNNIYLLPNSQPIESYGQSRHKPLHRPVRGDVFSTPNFISLDVFFISSLSQNMILKQLFRSTK